MFIYRGGNIVNDGNTCGDCGKRWRRYTRRTGQDRMDGCQVPFQIRYRWCGREWMQRKALVARKDEDSAKVYDMFQFRPEERAARRKAAVKKD